MAAMQARIAPEIRILAEQAAKEAMTGDPANRQAILKALERRLGRPRD